LGDESGTILEVADSQFAGFGRYEIDRDSGRPVSIPREIDKGSSLNESEILPWDEEESISESIDADRVEVTERGQGGGRFGMLDRICETDRGTYQRDHVEVKSRRFSEELGSPSEMSANPQQDAGLGDGNRGLLWTVASSVYGRGPGRLDGTTGTAGRTRVDTEFSGKDRSLVHSEVLPGEKPLTSFDGKPRAQQETSYNTNVGRDRDKPQSLPSRSQVSIEQGSNDERLESSDVVYARDFGNRRPHSKVRSGEEVGLRSRTSHSETPKRAEEAERILGEISQAETGTVVEGISDSVKDPPPIHIQKAAWGIPLQIMLKKETANEQRQSTSQDIQAISSFTNTDGQSSIQDNPAVESHNLFSLKIRVLFHGTGSLSKPPAI
jgi:hypothetical protein